MDRIEPFLETSNEESNDIFEKHSSSPPPLPPLVPTSSSLTNSQSTEENNTLSSPGPSLPVRSSSEITLQPINGSNPLQLVSRFADDDAEDDDDDEGGAVISEDAEQRLSLLAGVDANVTSTTSSADKPKKFLNTDV